MNATNKILLRLLGTALTVVGCAGCVVDSSEQADEIEFAAVVYKSTKTIYNSSTFPTTDTFNVHAYFSNDNFVNTFKYIDDETVAYNTSDLVWRCNSSKKYYWPLSGKLKFFAYSPTNLAASANEFSVDSSDGLYIGEYNMTDANTAVDVLYASATTTCPPTATTQPLQFVHALTELCFRARLADTYTNGTNTVTVEINSIKLNRINSKATFVQNPMGWYDQNTLHDYSVCSGLSVEVGSTTTPVDICSPVVMLPQSMNSAATMVVTYTVTQFAGASNEYSDMVTVTVPLSFTWESNYKVTYDMKVTLSAIEVEPSDCTWSSTTSGDIVI